MSGMDSLRWKSEGQSPSDIQSGPHCQTPPFPTTPSSDGGNSEGEDSLLAYRPPSIPRATIIRMISLVPSRIRCTRRSRTIFSIP